MKRVVSVSLGSTKGDFSTTTTFLGETFEISRIGVNGDQKKFIQLISSLDGKVDAFGLGGIDMYLYAGKRRYTIRDAAKFASYAKTTPVVDGSGIKNTIERETIDYLQKKQIINFSDKNVLVVCGVDRFGMAEGIANLTKNVIFGDLMFNIGVPIPLFSYKALKFVANTFLPLVVNLPFSWIYPTGEKQEKTTPKHEKYFTWADVIAGDYKLIGRYMPPPESGALQRKYVITNTLTADDLQNLKEHGVSAVISATWDIGGRTFATNVIEGIIITLAGKHPNQMRSEDYLDVLHKLHWEPTIRRL
jgi:hypothetical protein